MATGNFKGTGGPPQGGGPNNGVATTLMNNVFGGENIYGPAGNSMAGKDTTDHLAYNPVTGQYYDTVNGQTYSGPEGRPDQVVSGPTANQQIGQNVNLAHGLLGQLPAYQAREGNVFGQEQGLADSFNNTIHNPNAPSVAGTQLQQGLGAIQAQQLSQAAGQSGENGALARMNAAKNSGAAEVATNQAAALARAQEVTNAQSGLSGVLNGMDTQSQDLYKTNLAGALTSDQTAATATSALNHDQTEANIEDGKIKNKRADEMAKGATQWLSML